MRKSRYGTRARCKYCGQEVEFLGRDFGWRDRGGNRSCTPYTDPVTKEAIKPKTTHSVNRLAHSTSNLSYNYCTQSTNVTEDSKMTKQYYLRAPSGEVFPSEHPEYHKDCENLGAGAKGKAARAEYCKAELRALLTPGDTVYCILRSVSASGMSRAVSLYVKSEGDMRNVDILSADVLGYKLAKQAGVLVSGCGMDMGFHLVYSLGSTLWPDGTGTPPGIRNGEPDTDGGYALKHVWL